MAGVGQPGLVLGLVGDADEEHDVGLDAGHELDVLFRVEGLRLRGRGCRGRCRRGGGGDGGGVVRFGGRVVGLGRDAGCGVAC